MQSLAVWSDSDDQYLRRKKKILFTKPYSVFWFGFPVGVSQSDSEAEETGGILHSGKSVPLGAMVFSLFQVENLTESFGRRC
jgi:hypothetical protein